MQQEASSWDNSAPDVGPDAHAYAPAYQDPLAGPLPVATGSVGLQHEDRTGSGGFLRRIGRFAAEAAYIAGASGRMQRDVENIAIIRRPIGIGRRDRPGAAERDVDRHRAARRRARLAADRHRAGRRRVPA
jgi:hypothetical protein